MLQLSAAAERCTAEGPQVADQKSELTARQPECGSFVCRYVVQNRTSICSAS